jgi:phosphate:Na+ symporter
MLTSLSLFLTGLTLFLFGMVRLSREMERLFSSRIRQYIKFAVAKRLNGLLTGLFATILFQSSSATTLLTVGLVSAGLISFFHSLAIILGADIGTTLTVQLVVWKVTSLSPAFVFTGGLLYFAGKDRWKALGELVLYFGLIFYGLSLIGDATAPLKESENFLRLLRETRNPFLGAALGLVFTALIHASAIPVAILVIMGQQGLVSVESAVPIVLGANIGTTVTALLGGLVSNLNGKRTAAAHVLFKVVGVVVLIPLFPFFLYLLKRLSPEIGQQIVYSHFLFNVFVVLLFTFSLKPLARLVEKILPGEEEALPLWPEYLDDTCLSNPEGALDCVKKELQREMMLAQRMLVQSLSLIVKCSLATKRSIMYVELVVDNLQSEIVNYLWNISCGQLSPALSKKLFAYSTVVYDIERIGDRSTNIMELAESKCRRKAHFSEAAREELSLIGGLVTQNLEDASRLIDGPDEEAVRAVFERHREVVFTIRQATERHLVRFYQKVCRAEAGPIFVDMLVNLERISDHCQNIAESIKGLRNGPQGCEFRVSD